MIVGGAACAAPLQRAGVSAGALGPQDNTSPRVAGLASRRTVGVAFGGGSARGIAHVGVIRWLEEHRVPIDVAAGTSMGGLIGGVYATGMEAAELQTVLDTMDWDQLFGSSNFVYKNIRRKADARDYPSRLEFGLKGGIVPPTSLNSGEYVELFLERIAAPYHDIESFDALPTPFRTVAVDLVTASQVVLRRGSLADAMRATMSLPLIFPPVVLEGHVLVDGGAMNNVPADVVKSMGADVVIAVNVGELSNPESLSYTLLGLAGSTLDAMMRASTRKSLESADVVLNVPLRAYGSLDWRRAAELADEGYRAAEAMRDQLLPLAVSEAEYEAWRQERLSRRRTGIPDPTFVRLEGFGTNDAKRLESLLERHVGVPLDIAGIEKDLAELTGLDRYETITWRTARDESGRYGLVVRGRPKPNAPPFMMLGVNLENTTSQDFRITATARYLAFDLGGSGSELRFDGTLGSDPGVAAEWYRPIGHSNMFVAPYAGLLTETLNAIEDETVVARYGRTTSRVGINLGVNLGATSDVRFGTYIGHTTARIEVGDPNLPEIAGRDSGLDLAWRMDTQDSPVVPSQGVFSHVRIAHAFEAPDISSIEEPVSSSASFTQLTFSGNTFRMAGPSGRLFAFGGLGTTLGGDPPPTSIFSVGSAFRLGAYAPGEIRGEHAWNAGGGYLHHVWRLPDFIGGPVYAGGWLENGDAFDDWADAKWRTNVSVGAVLDTIVGPVVLAGTTGFDGRWRTYLGIGRVFR
ncbi:NTE family protein RssA [Luteitalea pratensis]|uniref:NTE family protein RssA n=1 Tax=Luteitalea pratensis TaxID=1855912 RepID=A0A143PJS8_LUTPR|nr:NTE family protein RssA [Luteitalea pratensis]